MARSRTSRGRRSGHVYFTLKDDSASIRAVLWRSEARRLPST